MSRAIWKGSLSFGLVHIPAGLFAAEKSNELSFDLLDKADHARIGYERVNKNTGKPVPPERIVKGYAYEPGQYVILGEDDFKRANVEATQTVVIEDFVDLDEIDPRYFEKPYYLAPLDKRGARPYALLRETMRRAKKAGVGQVVLRNRAHLAAVLVHGPVLVLETMRYHHELRDYAGLTLPSEDPEKLGLTERELEMAEKLVKDMVVPWQPERYQDRYADDLMALIEARVAAGQLEGAPPMEETGEAPERKGEVVDLMALLKKSLESRAPAPSPPRKRARKAG